MSNEKDENLVTVYTSTNNAIIALVKSMLDDAGIQYLAKGDNLQDTFAINAFPVEFQVMPADVDAAKELLKDVDVGDGSMGYGYEEGEDSGEEVSGDVK
jgi:hypothetical protein